MEMTLDCSIQSRYAGDMTHFSSCRLCPRSCLVDRRRGDKGGGLRGFCGESDAVRLALATLHRGEEPPLTGVGGSGAVFFGGCTLKCSFCQNHDISRGLVGGEVTREELAQVFLELERRGAENLNLVTGTHFLPAIIEALEHAKKDGFELPVLWNTSGYENDTGLELIKSFTDVFLPDLKTLDSGLADRLFKAPDYPQAAAAAILKMAAAGGPVLNADGMLAKGTLVRHLVLPGHLENTRRVLEWFAENLSGRALLSVMFQYLPLSAAGAAEPRSIETPAPARPIEDSEYYSVIGMLEDLGLEDGYLQEPVSESPWMPDFNRENPFPDEYSAVVWHWKHGFTAKSSAPG
jgi:putative pyruvate formate lyase activating enzyme